MNNIIELATEFQKQRLAYANLDRENSIQKKINLKTQEKSEIDSVCDGIAMTEGELKDFGANLEEEYSEIFNSKLNSSNKINKHGISMVFTNKVENIEFDIDLSTYQQYRDTAYRYLNAEDPNEKLFCHEDDIVSEKGRLNQKIKILRRFAGARKDPINFDNAAKNCQSVYYKCVEAIISLGIDIIKINKDLTKFKKFNMSCLIGGTTPFAFKCKKNNYIFQITFDDDCDCIPGILYVSYVINTKTQEQTQVNCDLFCQNTGYHILENFKILLSSEDFTSYYEKRFGHFIEIADLLQEKYICKCFNNVLDGKHIEINRSGLSIFYIEVTDKNDSNNKCLIVPYAHGKMRDYLIYVTPTLKVIDDREQLKSSFHYVRTYIDCNVFNRDMYPRFSVIYRSSNDLTDLINCVDCFMQYKNKKYGYFENNQYYNEHFIYDKFKKHTKERSYKKMSFYYKSNSYQAIKTGQFDLDIILEYNGTGISCALKHNNIKDMPYPHDKYQVRLIYDKKNDPDNCILTIRGKWYDIVPIAKKYHELQDDYHKLQDNNHKLQDNYDESDNNNYFLAKNEFIMSQIDLSTNKTGEEFEFKGTFLECYELMAEFHKALGWNILTLKNEEDENSMYSYEDESY